MRTTRENWIDRAARKWAGRPGRSVWNTTWDDLVTGDGNAYDGYPAADWYILGYVTGNDPDWWKLFRDIYIFDPVTDYDSGDSIGLPPDAVILGARLQVYVEVKRYYGIKPTFNVYSAAPITPGTLVAGDYTNLGSIPFCSSDLLYDDVVVGARNTLTLNATGIASISALEYINLGMRMANFDVGGIEPPHPGVSVWEYGLVIDTSNITATKALLELDYESSPLVAAYDAENVKAYSARFKGRLMLDGGLGCQCRFEYGETTSYGKVTNWQAVIENNPTEQGYFYAEVSGLKPNTTYHYRAVASNPIGTDYGHGSYADRVFTTLAGAGVTTNPATGVGAESATLNGILDNDGGEACECGFEWGETAPYGNTTPTQSKTTGQSFSQPITGLKPKTTYRFRAFATNSQAKVYGAVRTFTTKVALPTVVTNPAHDITDEEAALPGELTYDGGEACDCGFEWGETVAYGDTTPTQSEKTGQPFSQIISGLLPDTTYHFRAFATNSAGTSYGVDREFTTLPTAPSVTTDPATEVGAESVILNGTLDDDIGEACECGFQWGLDASYGVVTPTVSKTTGQSFSRLITGLVPNTIYHFRAFAANSAGTGYGADRTLTTKLLMNKAYALAREEL
jgi:hypothetical protein